MIAQQRTTITFLEVNFKYIFRFWPCYGANAIKITKDKNRRQEFKETQSRSLSWWNFCFLDQTKNNLFLTKLYFFICGKKSHFNMQKHQTYLTLCMDDCLLWAGFGGIEKRIEKESAANTGRQVGGEISRCGTHRKEEGPIWNKSQSTGINEEVWNTKHEDDKYDQL